jgi:hypothetical protein
VSWVYQADDLRGLWLLYQVLDQGGARGSLVSGWKGFLHPRRPKSIQKELGIISSEELNLLASRSR